MSYVKFVTFHLCLRILSTLSHLCIIHQPRWQITVYIYPLRIYKGCTGEAAETTNVPVNQTGWHWTIFLVTKRLKAKNLCLILLNLAGQKVLKLFLTPFLCFVNRPEYFLVCKGYQKPVYWTSLTLAIYEFKVSCDTVGMAAYYFEVKKGREEVMLLGKPSQERDREISPGRQSSVGQANHTSRHDPAGNGPIGLLLTYSLLGFFP